MRMKRRGITDVFVKQPPFCEDPSVSAQGLGFLHSFIALAPWEVQVVGSQLKLESVGSLYLPEKKLANIKIYPFSNVLILNNALFLKKNVIYRGKLILPF